MNPIAITMGCPAGIGPEITVLAVREARKQGIECVVVGDRGSLQVAATRFGLDPVRLFEPGRAAAPLASQITVIEPFEPLAEADRRPGHPTASGGRAQLAFVDHAVDLAMCGDASAIVTGPVSKRVIAESGAPGAECFTGHTEHIARRLGRGRPVMTFVAEGFAVALVTTHLPVRDVAAALTVESVAHATVECARLLVGLGKRPARVLVSALNPHAGEGGMLGREEADVIAPAVLHARSELEREAIPAVVQGPAPAEAAFRIAMDGAYDGVVAMYHDQGTIPMKLRYFGRAVNVTAGLPIIRTSVDHGTAYDIAGQGRAKAGSMLEAIRLAHRLARG